MTTGNIMPKWDEALGLKNANALRRRIVDIFKTHGQDASLEAMNIADTFIDDGRANLGEILQAINAKWKYQIDDWVRIQLIGFDNQPFTAQAHLDDIDGDLYYVSFGSRHVELTETEIIEKIPVEDIYPS